MRKVTLSIPLAVLALCLGAVQLTAQQPGGSNFQWYIGGQGGIINFATIEGRQTVPLGGAQLLITGRRTGLLLSVDQGFGSNEQGVYTLQAVNAQDTVVGEQAVAASFTNIRKYSAMLVAFPIRGPITPFFGIGVGILHTSGNTPDDRFTKLGARASDRLSAGSTSRSAGSALSVSTRSPPPRLSRWSPRGSATEAGWSRLAICLPAPPTPSALACGSAWATRGRGRAAAAIEAREASYYTGGRSLRPSARCFSGKPR